MTVNKLRAITLIVVGVMGLASCSKGGSDKGPTKVEWPEITMTNKPWTRWWWPASAVGPQDIDTMLTQYSKAGLGGVEVTTIYGVKGYEDKFLDYLSPEWMDLFCHTLDKAKEMGVGVDLANASGWPFGGPWVEVEDACRYLAYKTFRLKGGERLEDKVEYVQTPMVRSIGIKTTIDKLDYPIAKNDSLQQYAFEQVRYPVSVPLIALTANSSDGRYEDLTALVKEDGSLDWTAPEGDWTLCALFLGWHGKLVERAGPGGEGDVIDHFSARAIDNYLKKFDEAFASRDVSWIRYYFNDSYEVDDAVGDSDWTEDFFSEFLSRRGYDLKMYMPYLLGLTDDKDKEQRVVYDYRQTIGELLIDTYSTRWQKWAAAQGKGIRNQAHGSPANIMDVYAVSDVPETEGRSVIGMKTASSAAHVTGKNLVSSESATWLGDHFRSSLADVKKALDTYLLSGVNHIFYHGTCMSPNDAPWPGWLFYAAVHFQPTHSFWPDFAALNHYVARCQSFLQAGHPDNDILLYFNATDLQSERGKEKMLYHMNQHTPVQSAIGESAGKLYELGYSWDYITDKMICNDIKVKKGLLTTASGSAYKTIVVPKCRKMELETLEALLSFARKGAVVLVEESLPEDVPGLYELESRRARLSSLLSDLSFSEKDGVSEARLGKGRICVSSDLDALLQRAGVSRETMFDQGLECISRAFGNGAKYYFIKNSAQEAFSGWVGVDADFESAALYNPYTDESGLASIRREKTGNQVYLSLEAGQSILLQTSPAQLKADKYHFFEKEAGEQTLSGEWKVEFLLGGPVLPQSVTVKNLGSWTEYGPEYRDFSGSAMYSTSLEGFDIEPDRYYRLDLGEVEQSAAVYLDGKKVATLYEKPYSLTLKSADLAGVKTLSVRVSSSCENRIAYMDRNNIPWRIFYNVNVAARTPESRGEDGLFSAARWSTVPCGLMGPVKLIPLRVLEQ